MIRRVLFIIRDIAGEQAAGHPVTIASKTMADEPLERPVSALTFVAPERPRGQLASFYANLLEAPREGGVPAPAPALQPPPGEPLAAPGLDAEAGLGAGGGGEPQGSEGGGIESALSLEGLKPKRKGRQWSGHRVARVSSSCACARAVLHFYRNMLLLPRWAALHCYKLPPLVLFSAFIAPLSAHVRVGSGLERECMLTTSLWPARLAQSRL
jgi:hypothetical protein